ncbi:MAG TPA: histidine--tRNA ligase [Candidatus Saccharimonadales bacterium]|jgi:histidyl-tRNA synthetase
MAYLSTDPYKGTRDFYPADKRLQNHVFTTWRKVVESHGYEEYGGPILEPIDLYAAKTGQEIVNEQSYSFTDRGERKVTIRPEMTPTVSRMIAGRRQETGYPARWYSVANFMRYERPQRGREREFWQLNVDMFGVEGVEADAEQVIMAHKLMSALGATEKMYVIRINDRTLVEATMREYLQLSTVQSALMVKLFDRKGKMPNEAFRDQAIDIFGPEKSTEGLKKLAKLIGLTSFDHLPPELANQPSTKRLKQLFDLVRASGIANAVFDITLMRGLDYYTGVVFEVFDMHPDNNRSMFGGGRYDGLVGLFGVEPVPTVGFAIGYTTTEAFLQSHGLLPELMSTTDVYMIPIGEAKAGAAKLADELRAEGVRVAVDITDRKLDKQIKAAVKMQVPYLLLIGDKELASGVYNLRDTKTGTDKEMSIERIITTVEDYRGRSSDDF